MTKFKVGDRVIAKSEMAIKESGGREGTYLGYDDSNRQIIVQWDGKSSNLRYNETSVEVIVVNNDYDKAIEDMEAQLAELKAKREAEKKPKDHYAPGTVVEVAPYVPFYKLPNGYWQSSTNANTQFTWERLIGGDSTGPTINVLFNMGDRR